MPSSTSCCTFSSGILFIVSGWFWLCVPTVCPAAISLRTPSGLALAWAPMVKKVALTHWLARMASIWLLYFGSGPSSNVSTTS